MTHGRKPRRPRWPATNETLAIARHRAQLLSKTNKLAIMTPLQCAFTALREGVATEIQWCVIAGNITIALAIEEVGVIRGLRGHLEAADRALEGIQRRALASGAWRPTALFYQELDDVRVGIHLHKEQLEVIARGEYLRAVDVAEAQVRSQGGQVIQATDSRPPQVQSQMAYDQ